MFATNVSLYSVVDFRRDWAIGASRDFETNRALARFETVRAYVPNTQNFRRVTKWIQATFSSLASSEIVHADLCRPDLLVEIEGTLRWEE